jgi:hypothetical protein
VTALRLESVTRKDNGDTESPMRDNLFETMQGNEEKGEKGRNKLLEGTLESLSPSVRCLADTSCHFSTEQRVLYISVGLSAQNLNHMKSKVKEAWVQGMTGIGMGRIARNRSESVGRQCLGGVGQHAMV